VLIPLKGPLYCRVLNIEVDLKPSSGHFGIHLEKIQELAFLLLGKGVSPENGPGKSLLLGSNKGLD